MIPSGTTAMRLRGMRSNSDITETYHSLTATKQSTSCTCRRMSSSARDRYGSTRPVRKRSSPCSVQHTGRCSASRSGLARPMRSEFGRLTTSGTGSSAIHSRNFANSFRSTPRSPSSIEIMRSPSSFGSVDNDRLANALMTAGESHSRSRNRGVFRNSARCCCR